MRKSTNLKYHTTQRIAEVEAVRMVFSVSSFCLGETTADPSPAREADSLPYNGDRAFLRSRNRKWEKGANLSGYTTQRIADVEAGRIVFSVSSFCQHKITAHPSVFSFFPEIFLFGVFAKKKDRKKAIDFGPAASYRAECVYPGLQ